MSGTTFRTAKHEYRLFGSKSGSSWQVLRQPINQNTGAAWQATKRIATFDGECAKSKALVYMLKAYNAAQIALAA